MNGEDGKRQGMGRAWRAANPHWKRCMLESAKAVAQRMPLFDSEIVKRWCATHHPNATTHELRAIGPLMRSLIGLGIAAPLQEFNKSTWASCHRRDMRAWQSLTYRGRPVKRRRKRPQIDPRQLTMDL